MMETRYTCFNCLIQFTFSYDGNYMCMVEILNSYYFLLCWKLDMYVSTSIFSLLFDIDKT